MSWAREASEAGREAAAQALVALGGEAPALVVVFTAPRYDLSALLAGIRSITGSARLIGATGSGEMVAGRYMGFGAGVGVLVLSAGPYRFGLASRAHIRADLDGAGQAIARDSRDQAGPGSHSMLLLLADSLLGDLQRLVHGVYRVTGPKVPLVGGAAGDEQRFKATFVFHDDTVVPEGAVGLWITGEQPMRVVTGHGWQPIGVPMLVTRAEGTTLLELGGRPAAEAFEAQLGLTPGTLTPETFWATSIHHPFGLLQPDGSAVIRVARAKTLDGGLVIQGCVPQSGSAVQVMHGDADGLLDIVEDLARQALAANPGARVLLAFSCAARATIFGARAFEEAARLQAAAGDVPVFGIYCCGEFSRTVGVLGTHNATLTLMAL